MERLKHSKMYPLIRKCLVGLLIAVILALCVIPSNIGATNVSVVMKTGFTVNERSGAIAEYGNGEQLLNIDLSAVLQVNDRHQEQMLIYSTQHTSRVFVGDIETHNNQATPYVFDVQVNSLYSIRYILYQYAYEDSNGDIVPCGFQIYVRQYKNQWQEDIEPITKTQILQNTFTLDGVYNDTTIRITTTILPNQVGDYEVRYQEGYADGYQNGVDDTANSGLSEPQTAIGIILAPLTAITRSVQTFIYSMFDNPVGWIFIGIGALMIIVVVVFGIFKFIR